MGGVRRGEKEGTAPFSVTDAFRMTKYANLISKSDMTDGSAFFIANVNEHSRRRGNIYVHDKLNQLFGTETTEKLLYLL